MNDIRLFISPSYGLNANLLLFLFNYCSLWVNLLLIQLGHDVILIILMVLLFNEVIVRAFLPLLSINYRI